MLHIKLMEKKLKQNLWPNIPLMKSDIEIVQISLFFLLNLALETSL